MWTYLVEDLAELDRIMFTIRLNELGALGWEFFMELGNGRKCVFKRWTDSAKMEK